MKRTVNFALILFLACSGSFYSCSNGESSKNENVTDSTASISSSDSVAISMSKDTMPNNKNLHSILSIADTITDFAHANFTKVDSANYYLYPSYKSDIYPAVMLGEDFYHAYEQIVEGDFIYIYLNFSNKRKNPFSIFAKSLDFQHHPTEINLKSFSYTIPMISATDIPVTNQGLWVRPALLEKDSIDAFIKNLKNDSPSIDLAKDFEKYQIIIIPKVMAESKSGYINQYIGLILSIEKIGTLHPSAREEKVAISSVKQGTNPCPTCRQ